MLPNPTTDRAAFWQLCRAMAQWSRRAYAETTVADPFTSASALVQMDSEGDIVVAFQGSKEAKDFLQDAEFWRTPLIWSREMSAEVHHGFLEDFCAIDADVVGSVRSLMHLTPDAGIYICGHSLGGALAILCALEFARQHLPIAGVFTFGCPRVGNAAFAKLYNGTEVGTSRCDVPAGAVPTLASGTRPAGGGLESAGLRTAQRAIPTLRDITFRIVNQNDIVPRVPGPWVPQYRHCGTELFLEPILTGGWGINPSLGYKLFADFLGLYGAYRRRADVLITNHFIGAYQERIKNL